MRDPAGHGAHGLHLVGFAQLRLQFVAVRLGLLAAGEVACEHGGGLALGMPLEGHAHLHRQLLAAGGERHHLAEHGLGGQLGEGQGLDGIGQEAVERAAQRVGRGALEQGCGRRVEDGDALVLVHADDGVQRGVDDGLQAALAGVQLGVALLQGRGAVLQCAALGHQRALVHHGAEELPLLRCAIGLGGLDARDVQVARDARVPVADGEQHLAGLAVPMVPGLLERGAHAGGIRRADEGHERGQGAVGLGGLEPAVRHRIGLHHHVVLVQHHERQRHAGEQRLESFGCALRGGLAVAQHLVLHLQLGLVGAQFRDERGHRAFRVGRLAAVAAALAGRHGGLAGRARRLAAGRGPAIILRVGRQQEGQVGAAHGRLGRPGGSCRAVCGTRRCRGRAFQCTRPCNSTAARPWSGQGGGPVRARRPACGASAWPPPPGRPAAPGCRRRTGRAGPAARPAAASPSPPRPPAAGP